MTLAQWLVCRPVAFAAGDRQQVGPVSLRHNRVYLDAEGRAGSVVPGATKVPLSCWKMRVTAMAAASLVRAARSAPTKPGVALAMLWKLKSPVSRNRRDSTWSHQSRVKQVAFSKQAANKEGVVAVDCK